MTDTTDLELAILKSTKLRPRTKELYLRCVRSFLTFAGTNPRRWTSKAVLAWRDDMQTRGVKPQSINVALNALRFATRRRADKLRVTDLNSWGTPGSGKFADRVDTLPTGNAKGGRALTYNEGKRLVAACEGTKPRDRRDMAIVILGLRTGMLRFSMCQLQLDDLAGDEMTFVKKGGERHTFMMDPAIQAAFAPWIEWLRHRGIEAGPMFRSIGRERSDSARGAPRGSTPIGKGLTPDGLYRALQQRAKRARIADLNPHMFRETFLTWAVKAKAKPHQIAMVTGHKSDGEIPVGLHRDDPPANMLISKFIAPGWGTSSVK
jgi:integrase